MTIIQQLRDENRRLREEKEQTEKDIAIVANTARDAWNSLGIDLSKMGSGKKPNMMDITRMSLSIGKKMISGEIKIQELGQKWESINPILKKYEHVIEKTPEQNGN